MNEWNMQQQQQLLTNNYEYQPNQWPMRHSKFKFKIKYKIDLVAVDEFWSKLNIKWNEMNHHNHHLKLLARNSLMCILSYECD